MDWLPLKKFDESRLAISAVEMLHNKNYIVTFFEGKPDMWSTKPPLLIWLQMVSIKFFGINEVATRLPSALAATAICFFLYHIVIKEFNSILLATISVLILISNSGFVNMHGARSGDYDTLLTLFLFVNAYSFYKWIELKNDKYLLFFLSTIVLAVYTKGVAGLLFLPAYFSYLVYTKNGKLIFNFKLLGGGLISVFFILSYYYLREGMNPGYIHAVIDNELSGRYLTSLEGHSHGYFFYLENIISKQFAPWYLFAIIGLFTYPYKENQHSIIRFFVFVIFSFLLIISIAQTKIEWYTMPIFPFLALIAAIGLKYIYSYLILKSKKRTYFFLFLMLAIPYYIQFSQYYIPRYDSCEAQDYVLCEYIKSNKTKLLNYKNLHLLWDDYQPQNIFYTLALKEIYPTIRYNEAVQQGDIVLFYKENIAEKLSKKYNLKPLIKDKNISICQIL